MMMNTTGIEEIVEVEVEGDEDINHHLRMNIHLPEKETIENNIGINQMNIRTTT